VLQVKKHITLFKQVIRRRWIFLTHKTSCNKTIISKLGSKIGDIVFFLHYWYLFIHLRWKIFLLTWAWIWCWCMILREHDNKKICNATSYISVWIIAPNSKCRPRKKMQVLKHSICALCVIHVKLITFTCDIKWLCNRMVKSKN
jgi:hypothetical protein